MKFIFNKDIRDNKPFKVLMLCYLLLSLCFYVLMFFWERYNLGLFPSEIINTVNGNASLFLPAMKMQELIQMIHIKLFLYMFSSLLLLALFIRIKGSEYLKINTAVALFAFILIDVVLMGLVKWVPEFSYIKATSFVCLQTLSILVCFKVIHFLLTPLNKRC